MPGWNYAELWERIAERQPDAPAQTQGDRRYTWAEFNSRANSLAQFLLNAGGKADDKIAMYVFNGPEYLETTYAAFKLGMVPVNTNYRYVEDELAYLWDNADATTVVFHGEFSSRVESVRSSVPNVTTWLWVDDGHGPCPDFAVPYEDAVATPVEAPNAAGNVDGGRERSGDDILMIYTGGTTGMPKGTMWRQDDLIRATCITGNPAFAQELEESSYDAALANIGPAALPGLPACPLMHGTGWFTANIYLTNGGSVVTLVGRTFDVAELLDTIEREKVGALTIVGDAFAKPIVAALDAEPGRWDLTSMVLISSSGVMWSEGSKQGLLKHNPGMFLVDSFSSSEAIGMGQSVSAAGAASKTAKFSLGGGAKVITEEGTEVVPGSGERGRVAIGGNVPLGYYKDAEKTASTFITFEGRRYSCPGDFATVEADGTITLLGRGSVCINTAGEKVFPEEVEEILKLHDTVYDAVVVGVPDDRFGEMIVAVVQPADESEVDHPSVLAHVKEHLAGYKAPKHLLIVETIGRAPNAKVDYKRWKAYAVDTLA